MILRLFFSYFGGKWRIAKYYPKPKHNILIEPFAGSAGYALYYPELKVRLYDVDPVICETWEYLINASPRDILALPLNVKHVDEVRACQGAKNLIGFHFCRGTNGPRKAPSGWMIRKVRPRSFWGEHQRALIASQVDKIKHWKIKQLSYENIPDTKATYFIDPPYFLAGKEYKYHDIDYKKLGNWCKNRAGQIVVCENSGAIWLPFKPLLRIHNGRHNIREEAIWVKSTV